MGLDDFIDGDEDDRKDCECPVCGEEGKEFVNKEWLCTNEDCEYISWYNTKFELDIDIPEIW